MAISIRKAPLRICQILFHRFYHTTGVNGEPVTVVFAILANNKLKARTRSIRPQFDKNYTLALFKDSRRFLRASIAMPKFSSFCGSVSSIVRLRFRNRSLGVSCDSSVFFRIIVVTGDELLITFNICEDLLTYETLSLVSCR